MHLTGMEIRETPPFTEWVDLEFDRQVNLFIGPNASGKSTILNRPTQLQQRPTKAQADLL